jgi:hypothetical protein
MILGFHHGLHLMLILLLGLYTMLWEAIVTFQGMWRCLHLQGLSEWSEHLETPVASGFVVHLVALKRVFAKILPSSVPFVPIWAPPPTHGFVVPEFVCICRHSPIILTCTLKMEAVHTSDMLAALPQNRLSVSRIT